MVERKQYKDARRVLEDGYQILSDALGPQDPKTRASLELLVEVYQALGLSGKADESRKLLESSAPQE